MNPKQPHGYLHPKLSCQQIVGDIHKTEVTSFFAVLRHLNYEALHEPATEVEDISESKVPDLDEPAVETDVTDTNEPATMRSTAEVEGPGPSTSQDCFSGYVQP